MTNYRKGIHYLVHLTGDGRRCYEWQSKETGALRRWTGGVNGYREFLDYFGDDLTVLPLDWCHA
jgi:hypothetical protein